MAIQEQIYLDSNLGIPFMDNQVGVSLCGGLKNGGDDVDLRFNMPQQKHENPQQQYSTTPQQQYLLQLHAQRQQQQLQLKNQIFQATHGGGNFVFSATAITATGGAPIKNNNNISTLPVNTVFSQSIVATQMEKQSLEIDRYINLQSQRLKLALQEQRKQQLASIIHSVESKATILLRQKDDQIAQMSKRALELEDLMRKVDSENQGWKRIAREKEAMISYLNSTLEQLRWQAIAPSFCNNNNNNEEHEVDDAESCCEENSEDARKKKKMRLLETVDDGDDDKINGCCRNCGNSCVVVVFLPCRHLCSCKDCEPSLDACPVCHSPKQGTIEALI